MTSSKTQISDMFIILFIMLYPILPDYFVVAGYPVYLFFFFLAFFVCLVKGLSVNKVKYFAKFFVPILIITLIAYGYHGDYYTVIRVTILTMIIPIFVIFIYADSSEKIIKIQKLTAVVGILLCFSSLLERFLGFNVFSLIETTDLGPMGSSPYYRTGIRVEQSFSTSITFGLYLLVIATLLIILLKEKLLFVKKKYYAVIIIVIFLAMYFTESRMPLITLFVLYILFFLKAKFKTKTIIIIFLVATLLFDFVLGGYIWDNINYYIQLILNLFSGDNSSKGFDITSSYRMNLWEILWPYIQQKPIFGYGNQFMNAFTFDVWGHSHYSIDNGYLSNTMGHGLVGLLSVLLPLFIGIYLAIKMMKRQNKIGYYYLALYIIYLVNIFSVAIMTERRIYFLILALQLSGEYLWKTQQKGDHQIVKNRINGCSN